MSTATQVRTVAPATFNTTGAPPDSLSAPAAAIVHHDHAVAAAMLSQNSFNHRPSPVTPSLVPHPPKHSDSPPLPTSPHVTVPPAANDRSADLSSYVSDGILPRSGYGDPDGEPEPRPGSRSGDSESGDERYDDYELTEDQRQAMRELRELKLDLGYTEEDPPEYDVTDRVKQLNQELALLPTPPEHEARRSIKFKEQIVDLVAPPPDYSTDEEENPSSQQNKSSSTGASVKPSATQDAPSNVLLDAPVQQPALSKGSPSPKQDTKMDFSVSDHNDQINSLDQVTHINSYADENSIEKEPKMSKNELDIVSSDDSIFNESSQNPTTKKRRAKRKKVVSDSERFSDDNFNDDESRSASVFGNYNETEEKAALNSSDSPFNGYTPFNDPVSGNSNANNNNVDSTSEIKKFDRRPKSSKSSRGRARQRHLNDSLSSSDSPNEVTANGSTDDRVFNKTNSAQSEQVTKGTNKDSVLVERNGKFELVAMENLTPQERELHGLPADGMTASSDQLVSSSSSVQPEPPSVPRPATTNGREHRIQARGRGTSATVALGGRSRSAKALSRTDGGSSTVADRRTDLDRFNYTSPYAMSKEERERRVAARREEVQRKKKEETLLEQERQRKQEENDTVFSAWLRRKQEEAKSRRRSDGGSTGGASSDADTNTNPSSKKQNGQHSNGPSKNNKENTKNSSDAFNEWLQHKKAEQKRQQQIQLEKRRHEQKNSMLRPREENEKAYKQWIKCKNAEARKARSEEFQRSRIKRLMTRKSRKSQALAKALRQSISLKYVDYYGYRY